MYNDKVMDHFLHPRNVGFLPEYDARGEIGNSADGDLMQLFLKIEENIITQARFKTFGCAAAIATSSILTEMAIGKSLDEALLITKEDVAIALNGLPPQKMDCSNLAAAALHQAIHQYCTEIK